MARPIRKILLCTDFSENSGWAQEYALYFAQNLRARLLILHVVPDLKAVGGFYLTDIPIDALQAKLEREGLERAIKTCLPGLGDFGEYDILVASGSPASAIIAMAREQEADLIVMGTHGSGKKQHFLYGSTAERVIQQAPCPVTSVRCP